MCELPGISERQLRLIWQYQLLEPSSLRTSDGKLLSILSPGTPNSDCGPDFLDALVEIGSTLFRGDIEFHRREDDWIAHGHHLDTHYNAVILHVILTPGTTPAYTSSKRRLPVLLLPQSSLGRLQQFVTSHTVVVRSDQHFRLPCAGIADPSGEFLIGWLARLGRERLQGKVRAFGERLLQLAEEEQGIFREFRLYNLYDEEGLALHQLRSKELWEQLFYEGIMEGLGYSKNREAFRSLARNVSLRILQHVGLHDTPTTMAILFGAAGLLPPTRRISERESRQYANALRRRWNNVRPHLHVPLLHEARWRFFRLRPANLPPARLASFMFLLPRLFGEGCIRKLLGVFSTPSLTPRERHRTLRGFFQFEPDSYWSRHLYFGQPLHLKGIALGRARIDELIINTVIPLALLYSGLFRQHQMEHNAIVLYRTLPPLQKNMTTVEIERQLLRGLIPLSTAQLHQGALQLFNKYCREKRCPSCLVGKQMVRHRSGTFRSQGNAN